MANIFHRESRLKASAMRTVADRRFDDAVALCKTSENARANGAAYLAGFVIEILLKAQLVDRFPQTARKRQHEVRRGDHDYDRWSLIWRSHDLESMLESMPELEAALKKKSEISGFDYISRLKCICATWTIQARYSPFMLGIEDARTLLESVRSLKEVLK